MNRVHNVLNIFFKAALYTASFPPHVVHTCGNGIFASTIGFGSQWFCKVCISSVSFISDGFARISKSRKTLSALLLVVVQNLPATLSSLTLFVMIYCLKLSLNAFHSTVARLKEYRPEGWPLSSSVVVS